MKLHWKIIIGMVAGVVFGLLMSQTSFCSDLIKDWIKPFGTIFINLLKLIAMPLILASLVKGISDLKDISKLSTIGTPTQIVLLWNKKNLKKSICKKNKQTNHLPRSTLLAKRLVPGTAAARISTSASEPEPEPLRL